MTAYPIITNRLIFVWTSEPIVGPPDSWVSTKLPDPDLAQSRTHMLPLVFSDLKSPPICCSTRKAKKKGWIWGKERGLVFGPCYVYKRQFIIAAHQ